MKIFLKNFLLKNPHKTNKLFQFRLYSFSIFIKTQSTPNPNFLKFLPGKEIFKDGETYDFADIKQANVSPLARKIFEVNKRIL